MNSLYYVQLLSILGNLLVGTLLGDKYLGLGVAILVSLIYILQALHIKGENLNE